MYQTIKFIKDNDIARIIFNRPQAMNCFDAMMADELIAVTEALRLDHSVRVILLQGAGDVFMAGGDIRFFHAQRDHLPQGVVRIVRKLNTTVLNLRQVAIPIVAAVQGSVAGAGISLMLAADLVIAAEGTKFTLAYSGLGISPDGGTSLHLPQLVGSKKAMELLLLSELFDAQIALQLGLVNWLVAPEQFATTIDSLLTKLANGPKQAYARIKHLVNRATHTTLEQHLEAEAAAFEACSATRDFKEGVQAFLEKRKTQFTGE